MGCFARTCLDKKVVPAFWTPISAKSIVPFAAVAVFTTAANVATARIRLRPILNSIRV